MAFIEKFRDPPLEDENYDNLDCPGHCLDELRELGERFGWVPLGTIQGSAMFSEEERSWREETKKTLRPDWRAFLKVPRPSDSKFQADHFNERQKCLCYDLYEPREHAKFMREVTPSDALAWVNGLQRAVESLNLGNITDPKDLPYGVVITESASPGLNMVAAH